MSNKTLEQKVQELLDLEAMRNIMHMYCEHCDNNYNPEGIASLFIPDGDWEAIGFGKCKGRKEIADYFYSVRDSVLFAQHLVMNGRVSVDGDTGIGKFCLIMPATFDEGGEKVDRWIFSEYTNHYVRVDGKWFIKSLLSDVKKNAKYAEGFALAGVEDMTGLTK